MKNKIPKSYILFHEAADFILGANCENISKGYLFTEDEAELQELHSEYIAMENEGGISPRTEIEMEQKIDALDQFRKGLDIKRGIHLQVREHFLEVLKQYGSLGSIKTHLICANGEIHSFDVMSLYGSENEFGQASVTSEGFVIENYGHNLQPRLHQGYYILKKKDLLNLQGRILHELQEYKKQFEMTEEDWSKVEFAVIEPAKKHIKYEDLPNFSEENKQIIIMAREEYLKLSEADKGHGEIKKLVDKVFKKMSENGTPISGKTSESTGAFLKKKRQYWQ